MSDGWIGWDLDGTLAVYEGWGGVNHIGAPVMANLNRLRDLVARGVPCKIMTARVSRGGEEAALAERAIHNWLKKHGLPKLEVTAIKDFAMLYLVDDRAIAVEANTGAILGGPKGGLKLIEPKIKVVEIPESRGEKLILVESGDIVGIESPQEA